MLALLLKIRIISRNKKLKTKKRSLRVIQINSDSRKQKYKTKPSTKGTPMNL